MVNIVKHKLNKVISNGVSDKTFQKELDKRPLVPVVIFLIFGIIFARYFCIQPRFYIFILLISMAGGVFLRDKIFFYICIFLFGYGLYRFSLNYDLLPACDFVRENLRKMIYYNVPAGEERSLLAGLFLGERQQVSSELIDVFRNTNTIHILAISGDHIGFVGLIFVGMSRLMFIPRKVSAFIALVCVLVYVSVIGWQAPTFRAAVMFSVFAAGWIIDRPSDTINTLALAALIILLIIPQSLFQASFQLSFVIVLCLLIGAPNIKGGVIKKTLWGSFVAWISCLPLVAYYFKVISPISILANLVMVTGISVVLAIGFAGIFLGNIYIAVSGIFNTVNYFIIKTLISFLKLVSDIPYGYFYIENISIKLVFFSYLIIGIALISRPFSRNE